MSDDIAKAVEILKEGYLVAFPTETVYGLGGDATNWTSIRRIFEAKGRPPTNPLIIHVADLSMAKRYVTQWPDAAQLLAERFWPGALTLILPKSPQIVDAVTAGRNTVGVRVPNHPLALALLKAFDGPLAAPSANRSTRISPTTVNHVYNEGVIRGGDYVLDGGPCQIGIESTILDLTSTPPTILRPGAITLEQIESVIGAVQLRVGNADPSMAASSPGQQEVHYAPAAQAIRFEKSQFLDIQKWIDEHEGEYHCGSITIESGKGNMPNDPRGYAQLLYSKLRELDCFYEVDIIFIEMPPDTPEWLAVRDRIFRATRPFPPPAQ
jgi:L-threonylcarbamoyladenylate synthase